MPRAETARATALAALTALTSLASCASDRRAASSARSATGFSAAEPTSDDAERAPRHAVLRFDIEGLAPVPLVHAKIGAAFTWMQVDSGASAHTLPAFLVREGDLPRDASAAGIVVDAWGPLADGPFSVREQDPELPGARAGIAGLLSPQQLVDARPVILDLRRGEMRTASARDVERVLASEKTELTASAERCDGMYVVPAFVEGVRARLIVDTGAGATALFARSHAGSALMPRSVESRGRSFSVDGAMSTRTFHSARILVGDVHATRDVTLLAAASSASACAEDGVLGIDVLRACVLVFDGRLRIRCG